VVNDVNEQLERQVADVASRAVGPERHVDALTVARRAMEPQPRSSFRWLGAVAAGFILVLAAGWLIQSVLIIDDDDIVAPAGSPTPPASPVSGFDFAPVDLGADHTTRLQSIAQLPSGEIAAVGFNRFSPGSAIVPWAWGSADRGETWTASALPFGTAGRAERVIPWGDRFVAVGHNRVEEPAHFSTVWTSPDGIAWETLATLPDSLVTSVMVVPEGLALLGGEFRPTKGYEEAAAYPTVWLSEDGVTWQAHEVSSPWHEPGEQPDLPLSFGRSDAGDWMVSGPDWDEASGIELASVWIGAPGRGWDRAASAVSSPDIAGRFDVIASTPSGFVLTGERVDEEVSSFGIWTTPDGQQWEQVADYGDGPPLEFATSNGHLLAVFRPPVDWSEGGTSDPTESDIYRDDEAAGVMPVAARDRLFDRAPLYLSTDGRTWAPAPTGGFEGFPLSAAIGKDGTLIVAGADPSGCEVWWCSYEAANKAVPMVWIGTPESQQ
jgi:hypothetical protein